MNQADHTRRTELAVASLVAAGVAAAGTYQTSGDQARRCNTGQPVASEPGDSGDVLGATPKG